jgi:hypothetical protein
VKIGSGSFGTADCLGLRVVLKRSLACDGLDLILRNTQYATVCAVMCRDTLE